MKEYSAQKISEKILEYSELKNCITLEIGCGDGRITSFIAPKTKHLIGIDPDTKAIAKAITNVSEAEFQKGSGEELEFIDSSFDVVIFSLSLHHQNSQKALSEAKRVLKEGGKIIVVEPVPEGEIERIFSFLFNEDEEKALAQESILKSDLKVILTDVFTADWVFENENDLLNNVFQYYSMPFNRAISEKISNYLGAKRQEIPIICEDKMIIQILST